MIFKTRALHDGAGEGVTMAEAALQRAVLYHAASVWILEAGEAPGKGQQTSAQAASGQALLRLRRVSVKVWAYILRPNASGHMAGRGLPEETRGPPTAPQDSRHEQTRASVH